MARLGDLFPSSDYSRGSKSLICRLIGLRRDSHSEIYWFGSEMMVFVGSDISFAMVYEDARIFLEISSRFCDAG